MVKALKTAARNGSPISVPGIARQADLALAQSRNTRLVTRLQQSGQRLSDLLGERGAGGRPGRPAAIDELQRKITRREQCNVEPATFLEDRGAEWRSSALMGLNIWVPWALARTGVDPSDLPRRSSRSACSGQYERPLGP
ncbi:hypothetical protein [Streptomyces inhibens]|uniref:hypothetical protein n=1 Tax=Streptomyces inhibens TaxID=2293571 RepID=UPI001EE714CF|nr:hypothetical protein [Streptomyces inhibens]UKY53985.1 hypothetical protein KI385_37715 [Streptomyces inhibens]